MTEQQKFSELEQEHAVRERIEELIGEVSSLWRLDGIYQVWESRMKELAFEILKPGTDEIIDEYEGGLSALDYIWKLSGDYSWSGGQTEPFRPKALDYFIGRKVEHIWGIGTLVRTTKEEEYPPQYGIKVRLSCAKCKKGRITVYMGPGCHTGAFCYAHDRKGNYLADLRNQWFECAKCSGLNRKRKKP